MTDETREQIKRDAAHYEEVDAYISADAGSFIDGATHQHPIGIIHGIDGAIKCAMTNMDLFLGPRSMDRFIKELEALKTEIKK